MQVRDAAAATNASAGVGSNTATAASGGAAYHVVVLGEEDNSPIIDVPISSRDVFKRQQEAIITWECLPAEREVALSFQENVGCQAIWYVSCMPRAALHHPQPLLRLVARLIGPLSSNARATVTCSRHVEWCRTAICEALGVPPGQSGDGATAGGTGTLGGDEDELMGNTGASGVDADSDASHACDAAGVSSSVNGGAAARDANSRGNIDAGVSDALHATAGTAGLAGAVGSAVRAAGGVASQASLATGSGSGSQSTAAPRQGPTPPSSPDSLHSRDSTSSDENDIENDDAASVSSSGSDTGSTDSHSSSGSGGSRSGSSSGSTSTSDDEDSNSSNSSSGGGSGAGAEGPVAADVAAADTSAASLDARFSTGAGGQMSLGLLADDGSMRKSLQRDGDMLGGAASDALVPLSAGRRPGVAHPAGFAAFESDSEGLVSDLDSLTAASPVSYGPLLPEPQITNMTAVLERLTTLAKHRHDDVVAFLVQSDAAYLHKLFEVFHEAEVRASLNGVYGSLLPWLPCVADPRLLCPLEPCRASTGRCHSICCRRRRRRRCRNWYACRTWMTRTAAVYSTKLRSSCCCSMTAHSWTCSWLTIFLSPS